MGIDQEDIAVLAELIAEYGESVASIAWEHGDKDLESARTLIEDCYQGCWYSLEEWALDWLESTGELDQIPERLRSYFDAAAYARDLELGGDVYTIEESSGVHVFIAG